ncbi:MAG: FAD-dependent oxidoreductase [Spirosomataceae bacterium]
MNFSYWEQQSYFSNISVAIIGSGIVGLNAAIQLKRQQPHLHVSVFERGMLPSGASTKNAGFACFGSASELLSDLEKYTENEVFALVERRWKGLQKLKELVGEANMGFEQYGGYEVFDDEPFYEQCASQLDYLNTQLASIVGNNVYLSTDHQIPAFDFQGVNHLIFNAYEGQIDTGSTMKTLLWIARSMGIEVFNGALVEQIHQETQGAVLVLNDGAQIRVKQVLVTTNGFARQLLPHLDVTPGRGQVLVTAPIPNLRLKGTFHYDEGFYYFRNLGNRILLGGGRNLDFEAEATTEFGFTPLVQDKLHSLLRDMILPNQSFEIESRWSGIMGFGNQQAPIIQAVSSSIFCAVKMQGMGVAIGSLVGEEAAEMLLSAM